jgi:AbrB family looped-hinge helix DNA binding protein
MPATPQELTTIVSTKGRVILPKAIRDQRHWPSGTRLTVENTTEGVLLKAAPIFAETRVDAVFGSLGFEGKPKSIEEMDAAIAPEAKPPAHD